MIDREAGTGGEHEMKRTLIAFAGVVALVAGLGAASAQPGPQAALPMAAGIAH